MIGLLQDIIENPDDDKLRLIYADWCDDNGNHERAEFIRWQINDDNLQVLNLKLDANGCVSGCHANECGLDKSEKEPAWRAGGYVKVNRGFVCLIHCTFNVWNKIGPKLINDHPIKYAGLVYSPFMVEKMPIKYDDNGHFIYLKHERSMPGCECEHWLPKEIFDLMDDNENQNYNVIPNWQVKGYRRIADASKALKAAMFKYAKSR